MKHSIDKLPKWAQKRIEGLNGQICEKQRRIDQLEEMLPWTEPNMEWFTLWSHPHPEYSLFTCSEAGTRKLVTIGETDRVFIGRGLGCDRLLHKMREQQKSGRL